MDERHLSSKKIVSICVAFFGVQLLRLASNACGATLFAVPIVNLILAIGIVAAFLFGVLWNKLHRYQGLE